MAGDARLPGAYGGNDPAVFRLNMATFRPSWTAYEMRLMVERYVSDGMIPGEDDRECLVDMLGRRLHDYRKTVRALVAP